MSILQQSLNEKLETLAMETAVEGLTVLDRLAAWRQQLGLSNPGTVEQINKEIKRKIVSTATCILLSDAVETFLTNHLFDGARADLTKLLSPTFQATHSFHSGSATQPAGYSFNTAWIQDRWFLHGSIDNEASVQGRVNYQFAPGLLGKIQLQLGATKGQSMLQSELDYQGSDFSANIKAINPSPVDHTGVFVLNFLQSVTPSLAVGAELVLQRPQPGLEDSHMSYVARWQSAKRDQVATVNVQSGSIQASYWRKVEERVDAGAEIQIAAMPMGRKTVREAICSIGARYEFAAASFRAQVDTKGRVQAVLEERLAPGFAFTVAGELDHLTGKSKFGVGLMMES